MQIPVDPTESQGYACLYIAGSRGLFINKARIKRITRLALTIISHLRITTMFYL